MSIDERGEHIQYLKALREQEPEKTDSQKLIDSLYQKLSEMQTSKSLEEILYREARLKIFLILFPRVLEDYSCRPGVIEEAIKKSKTIADALFEDLTSPLTRSKGILN